MRLLIQQDDFHHHGVWIEIGEAMPNMALAKSCHQACLVCQSDDDAVGDDDDDDDDDAGTRFMQSFSSRSFSTI